MILFALVAVPISCYIVLHYTGERGGLIGPAVRGALWYAIGLASAFLVGLMMDLRYSATDLFLYFVIRDGYVPYLLGLAGFFVFYHRLALRDDRAMIPVMTVFLAAFFSVAAIAEIVLDTSHRAVYQIVILPSHRAITAVLVPVLFGVLIREGRLPLRALYTILILGLPAVGATAPLLLSLRYPVYGVLVGVVLPTAGVAGYLILRSAYYPERGFANLPVDEQLPVNALGKESAYPDEPVP